MQAQVEQRRAGAPYPGARHETFRAHFLRKPLLRDRISRQAVRGPVGINEHVGRRAIAAFGNSDGDLEMLQWTTLGTGGARFGLIVHHTDAEREYAYDRHSHFGKLDVALDAAAVNKWTVVDMKNDWKRIFAFD
jgi:hypothetical protein